MSLLDRFREDLTSLGGPGRALVAVSGGPDSVALLDLLVRAQDSHQLELVVAHVDHGIHPDSGRVAEGVRALAASYGLSYVSGRLSLGPAATETLARSQRYAWLEAARARAGADIIVTGHHKDEQIETVIMRVLAGSGPAGLAGMSPLHNRVARPLLGVTRAELAAYVAERGLEGWIDPANSNPRHLRSWIRGELLPLLRARVSETDFNLHRLAVQAAEDRAAWDAVLDSLPLDVEADDTGIALAAERLATYDPALQQAIILALARRVGCPLGPGRTARVLDLLQRRRSGTRVPLGAKWNAELAFNRLRLYEMAPDPARVSWTVEGREGMQSWGRWQFRWARTIAPDRQERTGMSAWFTLDPLTVRAWTPGERLKPLGGQGRRLVVRCFQEVRVPRSRRLDWPVLAQGQEVMWIPGVCRSSDRLPAQGTEALRVDAELA
jgi:tRNA(Ile)-lysidine synthase